MVSRPLHGCPLGTYGCLDEKCPDTCFCEEHCSWEKCKLEDPPKNCLINAKRKWHLDFQKPHWETILAGIFCRENLNNNSSFIIMKYKYCRM